MDPLRIEFCLATPMVVPKRPIHLDALLAFVRVDEAMKENNPDALLEQANLPLDSFQKGDDWVWKASQLRLEAVPFAEVHAVHMTRSYSIPDVAQGFASGRWGGRVKLLSMGTGPFKGYDLRTFTRQYTRAVGYCVGDRNEVERLLHGITHLGSTRRNNWGRIAETLVTVDEEAHEKWKERALPAAMRDETLEGHHLGTVSIRPPYWDRRGWQEGFEFAPAPAIPGASSS